jgi:hypothetical protein
VRGRGREQDRRTKTLSIILDLFRSHAQVRKRAPARAFVCVCVRACVRACVCVRACRRRDAGVMAGLMTGRVYL